MKSNYLLNIAIVLFLICIAFILQWNYLQDYPLFTHAWAQSDRFAISLRFLENGMNFFKPETYMFNPQFPHDHWVEYPESITAVDFPLHDYIVAIFMQLFNSKLPWIFKTYSLLYSLVGFYFLFLTCMQLTKSKIKSTIITVFAITSPVLVFYQAGFLPGIPSLANVFIAFYFAQKFFQNFEKRDFLIALLFLTLAILSRTTFLIPLVAFLTVSLGLLYKNKLSVKNKILPIIISLVTIVAYAKYNGYLREKYGSIFLHYIMPPKNWADFKELVQATYENWFFQYFTPYHYLFFISVFSIAIILYFKTDKSNLINANLLFTVLLWLGNIAFFVAMARQFPHHDYYFIDTFYFPIVVSLLWGFMVFSKFNIQSVYFAILLLITAPYFISEANNFQMDRRIVNDWDENYNMVQDYKNSEFYMDKIGVPKDAKIFVIDAFGPNYPFLLLNRRGYYMRTEHTDRFLNVLSWKAPYIIYQQRNLNRLTENYPQIFEMYAQFATNDTLVVLKLKQ